MRTPLMPPTIRAATESRNAVVPKSAAPIGPAACDTQRRHTSQRHQSHNPVSPRIAKRVVSGGVPTRKRRSSASGNEGIEKAIAAPPAMPASARSIVRLPSPRRANVEKAQPRLIVAPIPKTNPPMKTQPSTSHPAGGTVASAPHSRSGHAIAATHAVAFRKLRNMKVRRVVKSSPTAFTVQIPPRCAA